ncbi:MAG: transporter substrate-binding domain-containing protein, partial [Spirochaetaceae bacterium]|nr:transporter substrate-binding domain-containing protein [Spirochaetaceae bacterium]
MRENSNSVKSKHPLKALLLVLLILQPVFLVSQDNTIKVGWFPQPSFIEQEQYENPSGYVQVYLEHIAQYTGWNYEFVKGDFEVLYKQLTEGKIDILPCLFYTEERDEILDFSESEMGTIYSTLFVRSDSPLSSNDPLSYNNIIVAAERDENPVKLLKFAKENGFTVDIRYYPSLQAVI